jgi:hypothetical protein
MVRHVLVSTVVVALGLAVACGKSSQAPTSPSSAAQSDGAAAADGSTLKATAPTPVSPVNGGQPDVLVLTANAAQAKFGSASLQYQIQVRSGSTTVYDSQAAGVSLVANGGTITLQPAVALTPDGAYTWRIRALLQGAFGPWSSDASFKAPVGGYIRGSEIFDPLVAGRSVGTLAGSATLTADGVFFPDQVGFVRYVPQQTLSAGEMSAMVKGLSRRNTGEKSKVFSMAEGFGDVTDNDYRMTVDFRARQYPDPGAVTFRIITGDAGEEDRIFDSPRVVTNPDPNVWYLWKFTWQTGFAQLRVTANDENGPVLYQASRNTGGHEYRPSPQVVYIGQPPGRGGPPSATVAGITVKSFWFSANPRPVFPN